MHPCLTTVISNVAMTTETAQLKNLHAQSSMWKKSSAKKIKIAHPIINAIRLIALIYREKRKENFDIF